MIDTTIILWIIGAVLTMVVAYWGVRTTIKLTDKVELTFYEGKCFKLFDTIVKHINGININFEGKPISENLILLKGVLVNTGNRDIDSNIMLKPLNICLPVNYEWRQFNIVAKSDGLETKYKVRKNIVEIEWDLLKRKEYFRIDSLIEFSNNEKQESGDLEYSFLESIQFETRISNLTEIKIVSSPDRRSFLDMYSGAFVLFILILLCFYGLYLSIFKDYELEYQGKFQNKNYEIVNVEIINQSQIKLTNQDGKFINKGDIEQLFNLYKIRPFIKENIILNHYVSFGIFLIFIVILILLAYDLLKYYLNFKRLNNYHESLL